ncbi:hypothetical protein BLA29_014143 [Euroglyphus maynei]|uniref:Uncharacterized protein n=1 Tax=Euroglyphus maynei TaxID=6958 RepID=A0A1Y3B509_EURMA|nr:hypothetical protein BLA29_014143 [Euroglyphus maynei]
MIQFILNHSMLILVMIDGIKLPLLLAIHN